MAERPVIWKEHIEKLGMWNFGKTLWMGEKCKDIFAYIKGHQKVTSVRRGD